MRDRLIELFKQGLMNNVYCDEIADYLLANGVIVPPVNIGDKVYTLGNKYGKRPVEWEVVGIWFSRDKSCDYMFLYHYIDKDNFASRQVYFNEIGKTVFLAKEEAELVLKGSVQE